jgi:hypothetical protein
MGTTTQAGGSTSQARLEPGRKQTRPSSQRDKNLKSNTYNLTRYLNSHNRYEEIATGREPKRIETQRQNPHVEHSKASASKRT